MSPKVVRWLHRIALAGAIVGATSAHAHSASDAYLTLTAVETGNGDTHVDGRFDIALRDLDFVLGLDVDGDGSLTWGEVRRRRPAIERLAYDSLHVTADGSACRLDPVRQQVADRADGTYATLVFRVTCKGRPREIGVDYCLFFAIDPSHRGILVFRGRGDVATALLSPGIPRVTLGF